MRKDTSRRGWIIAVSCFCIGFIIDGVQYSYGLLFIELLTEFKKSRSETSWIGALFTGWYIFGPVVSILTNRFGCRSVVLLGASLSFGGFLASVFSTSVHFLYVSYGCLGGFGFLMMNISKDVVIIQYFKKKRSFAMGISVCGSGIGTIVFNPLTKWLIDEYGWRGTLLIEAGLMLNCLPFGLVMKPFVETANRKASVPLMPADMIQTRTRTESTCDVEPNDCQDANRNGDVAQSVELYDDAKYDSQCQRPKAEQSKRRPLLKLSLLKRPKLMIFITAIFFRGMSYYTPFNFIPDMAVQKGWSRAQAAWLITAIGIANTVCRIPIGRLADMKCVNRTFMLAVVLCVLGILNAVVPHMGLFKTLVSICALYGIALAFFVVIHQIVVADLFGEDNVTDVFGYGKLFYGIGCFTRPLSGALVDVTGNYTWTFTCAAIGFEIASVLTFVLFVTSRSRLEPT